LAVLGSFGVDESETPSAKGTNPPYASSVVAELFRDGRRQADSSSSDPSKLRVRVFYNRGVKRLFRDAPLVLKCCRESDGWTKGQVRACVGWLVR
jgi:hypothetical protein